VEATVSIKAPVDIKAPQVAPPEESSVIDGEERLSVLSLVSANSIAEEEVSIKTESTFKYSPTIYIYDDEKLSVNGWKILCIDAMCGSIQSNITHLSYGLKLLTSL
jgi:hypothetical protein